MSGAPIPSQTPDGPFFVDTASCQCALQPTHSIKVRKDQPHEVWRCIGDTNGDAYVGDNGKWFFPINPVPDGPVDVSKPIEWGDNPPDSKAPYIVDNSRFQPLEANNSSQLSLVDKACTGENSTEQSAQYYSAIKDVEAGRTPPNGALCYSGMQPFPLQNATEWNNDGCNLGFFCKYSLEGQCDSRNLTQSASRPEQYRYSTPSMVSSILGVQ